MDAELLSDPDYAVIKSTRRRDMIACALGRVPGSVVLVAKVPLEVAAEIEVRDRADITRTLSRIPRDLWVEMAVIANDRNYRGVKGEE